MNGYSYQYGFSDSNPHIAYNVETRNRKAHKILSVLNDYYQGDLKDLSVLDVGCSTGIIDNILNKRFAGIVGIDIDVQAVTYARENFESERLRFFVQDGMEIEFPDEEFDVVLCANVYEHVPDAFRMFSEIRRVLKIGGVCFFLATNRLILMDYHYSIPFLSIFPRQIAGFLLRISGKGRSYYERRFFLWELRKLVSGFDLIDYTLKLMEDPGIHQGTGTTRQASRKQKLKLRIIRRAYWLSSTYVWLLKKSSH